MTNTKVVNGTWIEFTGWAGFKLLVGAAWKLVWVGSSIVVVPKTGQLMKVDHVGVQ